MEQGIKRVAVKIGSNVLTRPDGSLDLTRMSALVDQIAALYKAGIEVILISSGAVASGRSELCPNKKLDSVDQRQLFSAIGQTKLLNRYYELFREYGILVGQVLTTKESFSTRRHYLNQKRCMSVMLDNGVLPIVNENDTISVTELMFTDNDELSGLIASMMNVQKLIILSNIDGIYDGDPSDPRSSIIRQIGQGTDLSEYIQVSRSNFGRGGMLTKTAIARKVAAEGITVMIGNGRRDNILQDLIFRASDTPCTIFTPSITPVSSIKKWIAHSDGFAKGEIHIDRCATELLNTSKAVSVLPIGVTLVEGEFEKDDIVRLVDYTGRQMGVGKANCSSQQARDAAGNRGKKVIVHYDYLYIE